MRVVKQSRIDANEIKTLYQSGLGLVRLARHFGVSPSAIRKRLKKLRLMQPGGRAPKKKKPGECGYCGNCQAPLKPGQRKFCSSSCSASITNRSRSGRPVERPCAGCGSQTKNRKFCSTKCSGNSRRKPEDHKRRVSRLNSRIGFRLYCARLADAVPVGTDMRVVREIYANCPAGYDVDHIIPITRGGLHHPENLQYLPSSANKSKGNKLPVECPEIMALALPAITGGSAAIKMRAGAHRFPLTEAKSKSGDRSLITA